MRRSKTLNISEIMEAFLQEKGLHGKLAENRLLNSWEELLGKTVAKATKNLYIQNKTLFVSMSSSIVRHEIMMIRDELIKRLNEKAGRKIIDSIVIR